MLTRPAFVSCPSLLFLWDLSTFNTRAHRYSLLYVPHSHDLISSTCTKMSCKTMQISSQHDSDAVSWRESELIWLAVTIHWTTFSHSIAISAKPQARKQWMRYSDARQGVRYTLWVHHICQEMQSEKAVKSRLTSCKLLSLAVPVEIRYLHNIQSENEVFKV